MQIFILFYNHFINVNIDINANLMQIFIKFYKYMYIKTIKFS